MPGKNGDVRKYRLDSLNRSLWKIIWRGRQNLAAGTEQAHGTGQLVPDKVGRHPQKNGGADGQQGEHESAVFCCSSEGYPLIDKFTDRSSGEKIVPLFSAVLGSRLEVCI